MVKNDALIDNSEELVGIVTDIIYRNNDSGYTIIKIEYDGGDITATGKFPIIGEGEQVRLVGTTIDHPKYGFQFKADKIFVEKPTTCEQIIKYLSSGLISGVGPITATNIVNMFKEQTLDIIAKSPMKLVAVKGISSEKAMQIGLRYNEVKKLQDAVIFLQGYDVSTNMAVKIYEKYKDKTEQILTKNPYRLVEDIEGIGFRTADKIAIKMGITKDSTFRMRAGIIHTLNDLSEKTGSTLFDSLTLKQNLAYILNCNELNQDVFEQTIANLIIDGFVKECVQDQDVYYCLVKLYKMEKVIATKINLIASLFSSCNIDVADILQEYEQINGISLHEQQKQAVSMAVNNGISIITGGPGTGKTTIIKAINFCLKRMGLKSLLLAPTGRASKRLADATGEEAKTIHRALDINFKGEQFANAFVTVSDIEQDAIIVDEVSMVDTYVMYNLIKAVDNTKRFIMVGDKDQLPSVGAGNILDDLITSCVVPVCNLTQIYRQAEKSGIVMNAHRINNGEMIKYDNKSVDSDFFVSTTGSTDGNLDLVVELATKRLCSFLDCTPGSIQVLAPMKAGVLGVNNLNLKLQQKLNPASDLKPEVVVGSKLFRVGDRVMQTVNNYDQEWIIGGVKGSGVFNGDVGIIEEINTKTDETTVLFEDGRRCYYMRSELDELMLSYAITIHKSQGSEFDAVIIPLSAGNPAMLTKNLLYTAVTRAKKMVVIVGESKQIYAMIKNDKIAKRTTSLKQLLTNPTFDF